MLFTILKLLQAILIVLEYSFSVNTTQYNANLHANESKILRRRIFLLRRQRNTIARVTDKVTADVRINLSITTNLAINSVRQCDFVCWILTAAFDMCNSAMHVTMVYVAHYMHRRALRRILSSTCAIYEVVTSHRKHVSCNVQCHILFHVKWRRCAYNI